MTATSTAQPATSTSASTVSPKTATQQRREPARRGPLRVGDGSRRGFHRDAARTSPPDRGTGSPAWVAAGPTPVNDDPATAEHAPAPWRRGARNWGNCGRASRSEGGATLAGLACRRRRHRPGGLRRLELSLTDRPCEALAVTMLLAGVAGLPRPSSSRACSRHSGSPSGTRSPASRTGRCSTTESRRRLHGRSGRASRSRCSSSTSTGSRA